MAESIEPNTKSPIGDFESAWIGHSTDVEIRKHAASGGIVTATFKYLLEEKIIDAALVCRSKIIDGEWVPEIFLAKNFEELQSSQSSKYFDIPMTKGLKLIKEFDGKVGVVGLPSQINSISRRMAKDPILNSRICFKISVFCGHNSKDKLAQAVLLKKGINPTEVEKFYYRQGLWRGEMVILMKDGSEHRMRFQEFSHYQNLHILSLTRCLNCFDHFGYHADLSTGDVWLPQKRKETIKPSIFLARNKTAKDVIDDMLTKKLIDATPAERRTVYMSQSRSVNYHYNISARAKVGKWLGFNIRERIQTKVTIRDLTGAFIVLINHKISENPRLLRIFMSIPLPLVTLYLFIFKGLMHYKRKDYEREE
ncbi:MAG: Coenzyme F420 hydrogenase/dehydrogenase, beta subunit C-terminal domain [Opitutaceae bacterium]